MILQNKDFSMFPVDLQKAFEMDIVSGTVPAGQRIDISAFQQEIPYLILRMQVLC